MTRRRGSAVLYVMVMLVIMTSVTITYCSLSNATRTSESRREQAVIARLAFDGATLKAAYDAGLGNVAYPSTQTETVGQTSCAVKIADNSTNLAHSLTLTSSTNLSNRTYSDSRVLALKMPASQFFYCLATNTDTTINKVTTGASGANGDIYCSGDLDFSGNDTINGDAESTGTVASSGATITGQRAGNTYPIPLVAPIAANYSAVASFNLINILLGILISGETFTTPYMVVYCNGDTTFNGTFTGKGIVFVNGNATVNASMNYLLPGDEVAIIVTGNVTVSSSNTNLVGYWYCGGSFSTSSNTTLTKGCIVTNSFSTGGGNFQATYDPTIWNTPGEANRMKLPGFWP